jgi:hypothetical protein
MLLMVTIQTWRDMNGNERKDGKDLKETAPGEAGKE